MKAFGSTQGDAMLATWQFFGGVGFLLLAGVILAFVEGGTLGPGELIELLAAVGTAAAVVVAMVVANASARAQALQERQRQTTYVVALVTLAERSRNLIRSVREAKFEGKGATTVSGDPALSRAFSDAQAALARFPLHEAPTPTVVRATMHMIDALGTAAEIAASEHVVVHSTAYLSVVRQSLDAWRLLQGELDTLQS